MSKRRTVELTLLGVMILAVAAGSALAAEIHKELRFAVSANAGVSINNQYGLISVKPSAGNVIVVNAVLYSDKVEVDNSQTGNRVDIQSHLLKGADSQSGRVDYEISVPADASVTMHSTTGPLRAEKLHGDVTLEGSGASVEVRDVSNAHLHVRTLNGPVILSNVQDEHVEVDSLTGDVMLDRVTGQLVQVISTSGRISYTGDFGSGGLYRLTSHSGDIEAIVPESTSADVSARSVKGEVHDEIPLQPKPHAILVNKGSAFFGTMGKAAVSSTVVLRSFSGKIQLRKRTAKQ